MPLTDFGPTFSLNIGGIAVFAANNDPNQSIVFAATGEGDTGSRRASASWLDGRRRGPGRCSTARTTSTPTGNILPIDSPAAGPRVRRVDRVQGRRRPDAAARTAT